VPIPAFGGGLVVLPWEGVTLSALVLAPSGTPTNHDASEAFQDGVFVSAEGWVKIKPCGLSATACDDGHLEVQCRPELRESLFEKPLAISNGSWRYPRGGDWCSSQS
jgi:hypothetical protein